MIWGDEEDKKQNIYSVWKERHIEEEDVDLLEFVYEFLIKSNVMGIPDTWILYTFSDSITLKFGLHKLLWYFVFLVWGQT